MMELMRFVFFSITFMRLFTTSGALTTSVIHSRAVTNTSKAGLGWPNADTVNIEQYESLQKISWYYTWSVWPISQKTGLEYVPMLWGPKSVNEFNERINTTIKNASPNVTAILGMNEPEQKGQSNMTVQEGVDMWKNHMEPLRSRFNVRLGSPVVSSGPAGKAWISDFLKACNGSCTIDFLALHWYGTNPDEFIAYLWDFYYAFNKTIWVTEWACHNFVNLDKQCTKDEVVSFLNKTQSFMDNSMFVERYAWYGAMKDTSDVNGFNAIMDKNGKVNALGTQYGSGGANGTAVSLGLGLKAMSMSQPTLLLFVSSLIFFSLVTF